MGRRKTNICLVSSVRRGPGGGAEPLSANVVVMIGVILQRQTLEIGLKAPKNTP